MKLRFIIEVLLFALMTFSCVWSADVIAAQVGYYSTDDVALRTDMIVKLRGYLLNALRNYFAGSEECSEPEPFPHQTVETSFVQRKQPITLVNLPPDVFGLIEKFLERKEDVCNFMLVSSGANVAMNEGIKLNLSAFCPQFVFTHDFRLSRLFYLALIKDFRVATIKDNSLVDTIQLLTIKRTFNDLQVPKLISTRIFDHMFMCLSEAVNGLNSTIPLTKDNQILSFSEVYNRYDLPKTVEYIKNNYEKLGFKMEFLDFFKNNPNPSQEQVESILIPICELILEKNLLKKNLTADVVKLINFRLMMDLKDLPKDFPVKELEENYLENLEKGIFAKNLFDKICEIGLNDQFKNEILGSCHLEATKALIKTEPGHLFSKAHYALSRSATGQFECDHYLTLTGKDSTNSEIFRTFLSGQSLNLAQIDAISKMVRSGIINLTSLTAPNRTSDLIGLLKCPNYDLLDSILNEISNYSATSLNLNLFISFKKEFYPLFCVKNDLDSFAFKVIIQHFISKHNDDPLPILFFHVYLLNKINAAELIQNKFDLNKKYLFDYDFDQIKIPFLIMNGMSEEELAGLKGTVMDFKTIVQKISALISDTDIKPYFTSNPDIFNDPTPENIKPISLKRYFEDGVFEEVEGLII